MRSTYLAFVLLVATLASGCALANAFKANPLQVTQTVLTDAQWGVTYAYDAQYLTAIENQVISEALSAAETAAQAVLAGQTPQAAAKAVLVNVESQLPVDSRLRPYFDAAIILL